jgi:hypothetical protein
MFMVIVEPFEIRESKKKGGKSSTVVFRGIQGAQNTSLCSQRKTGRQKRAANFRRRMDPNVFNSLQSVGPDHTLQSLNSSVQLGQVHLTDHTGLSLEHGIPSLEQSLEGLEGLEQAIQEQEGSVPESTKTKKRRRLSKEQKEPKVNPFFGIIID